MNTKYVVDSKDYFIEAYSDTLLASQSSIKKYFHELWPALIQNAGLEIDVHVALKEFRNLVVYEALDGSRSTLPLNLRDNRGIEGALYVINFIHILQTLGVKTCCIMIHTSYNRKRGASEFQHILQSIESGATSIKKYALENNVRCSCFCVNTHHELTDLLHDISDATKNGLFHAYFLFDYNEEWAMSKKGQYFLKFLPDIDVHIRHTKFQFSGGWIPGKMSRSVFLYSQNGTTYTNWDTDELIVLINLALLAKLLQQGEGLNKIYTNNEELIHRYDLREKQLFNRIVRLRDHPKKLFMIGSPVGIYQFYY